MDWTKVFETQLRAAVQSAREPKHNPRPLGSIQAGSATEAVLALLRDRKVWLTHAQIVLHTKRTSKSIDWALLFLRSQNLIETVSDSHRNPRYLRYRAVQQSLVR